MSSSAYPSTKQQEGAAHNRGSIFRQTQHTSTSGSASTCPGSRLQDPSLSIRNHSSVHLVPA